MSRTLSKSVVSGGVVYPAGATVPDEVAKRIVADVWVEDSEKQSDKPAAKSKRPATKRKG